MADIKACDLTEPHRGHNWQESKPYNGFVPQMIPLYHVCPGVSSAEHVHTPACDPSVGLAEARAEATAYRERRIRALARLRFMAEQERMLTATHGHVLPEWTPARQEHYEDKARFEIELAEKTMADADTALTAFPEEQS